MPRGSISHLQLFLFNVPLVLLITGTLIELFAFLWRKSSARIAAKWMIGLGVLTAVPVTAAGFYGVWTANRADDAPVNDQAWHHTRAQSPIQGTAWELLRRHAVTNAGATAVLLLIVIIWLGATDTLRDRLHIPLLIVMLACVVAIVYDNATFGSRYAAEQRREAAGLPVARVVTTGPATQLARYVPLPPLQLHIILAGFSVALAAASLGLSFRAASHSGADLVLEPNPGDEDYAAAFMARNLGSQELQRAALARMHFRKVPAGRYWLLTFVVVGATVTAGLWTLASFTDTWHRRELYEQIVQLDAKRRPELTRRFAHAVTGTAILLLPLILGLAARFSPRRGFIAAGFGLLLGVAVGAQIWFGSLLMLDSPAGRLDRFNSTPPATQPAPVKLDTEEPATLPTTAPAAPPPPIADSPDHSTDL